MMIDHSASTVEQEIAHTAVGLTHPDDLLMHVRHEYLSYAKRLCRSYKAFDMELGEQYIDAVVKLQEALDIFYS